ncbi:hypothetical protein TNCT_496861, partial [Trichonephila clavata]
MLISYGDQHRTSFVHRWHNNYHHKTGSSLSYAAGELWLHNEVQKDSPARCTDVAELVHERVFFNTKLDLYTNNRTDNREYLTQIALDIINKVPCDALQICTDSSMGVSAASESGVFLKKGNGIEI